MQDKMIEPGYGQTLIVKCFKCGWRCKGTAGTETVNGRVYPESTVGMMKRFSAAHQKARSGCHAEWKTEHMEIVSRQGSGVQGVDFASGESRTNDIPEVGPTVWEVAASGGRTEGISRQKSALDYAMSVVDQMMRGRSKMDLSRRQFAWVRGAAERAGIEANVEERYNSLGGVVPHSVWTIKGRDGQVARLVAIHGHMDPILTIIEEA